MIEEKDIKGIGKFQKTHALKGELNALLDIDSEYVAEGNAIIVDVDGIFVPFYASSIRPKGAMSYLIRLEGIDNEEEARKFVNKTLYGIKSELSSFLDIEEDELMDENDFSGYHIIDENTGHVVGMVISVDSTTENLLFIVKTSGCDEVFVPAADDLICSVDDVNKTIRMYLPEGLVDLNKK